jgi:colanic acid/amylovoran biosynthesis glycosyltransferase
MIESLISAASIHCVSQAIQKEVLQYGIGVSKTCVIPPAVDLLFFHPLETKKPRDSVFRIISVGTFTWVKGYEVALSAIANLRDRHIPVEYTIIGDGPERNRLLYTIQDLKLDEIVHLVGKLAPDQVRERLWQNDVFLLSSHSEGISNAALEAMACELPVVTTTAGGMGEAVADGVEGYLVPVRDPISMADRLEELWERSELRIAMGNAARERVVKCFSLQDQIYAYKDLFQRSCKSARIS